MRMEKHEAKKVFSHPMETNPQKNHQQKKHPRTCWMNKNYSPQNYNTFPEKCCLEDYFSFQKTAPFLGDEFVFGGVPI